MTRTEQITKIVEELPEQDQEIMLILAKKFVRAWDPDYTKLTQQEAAELEASRAEALCGNVISQEDLLKELSL